LVAALLEKHHPGLCVELTVVKTSGDMITDKPLHELGGKGLFTKELEQALLAGQIDLAVHSFKDVPVTMPLVAQDELIIGAVPTREDPRDVLVSATVQSLRELPTGAVVGTGSLRRRCQLQALRPDLQVQPIRGNIDTRLRKLREGEFDALILAAAGLRRAGLFDPSLMHPIDSSEQLPAAGQGALAIECRRNDDHTHRLVSVLNDPATAARVTAERELVKLLEGDCHSPIGAFAEVRGDQLILRAAVGGRGGVPPVVRAEASAPLENPLAAAQRIFDALGPTARNLLHGRT
jgi:hydroxymethylbilane synthase